MSASKHWTLGDELYKIFGVDLIAFHKLSAYTAFTAHSKIEQKIYHISFLQK